MRNCSDYDILCTLTLLISERMDRMLTFEEELAKFKPSRDIDQVEDTIVNRDITDVTDIMVEFLKEQYEQDVRE